MEPAQSTPRFDRLCIFVLAFEWIVFGSMHFSFPVRTAAMVPHFIPEDLKPMVVVITGMIEVSMGILILASATRKWAALVSLVLLGLYIPAVYTMLGDDTALPQEGRTFIRVLLLPNNIFLALCSIQLWRHPITPPIGAARIVEETMAPGGPITSGRATLLVAFLFLAANCAGFMVIWASPISNRAPAYLWAMMCIATGAFVGFLFGVPRLNPDAVRGASLLPNANIETVSDWLTKIIVGVGLVNLREIGMFLQKISGDLAVSIGDKSGTAFATALILYFFFDGLIQGYLLTRMFLAWQFSLQLQIVGTSDPQK